MMPAHPSTLVDVNPLAVAFAFADPRTQARLEAKCRAATADLGNGQSAGPRRAVWSRHRARDQRGISPVLSARRGQARSRAMRWTEKNPFPWKQCDLTLVAVERFGPAGLSH